MEAPLSKSSRPSIWTLPILCIFIKSPACDKKDGLVLDGKSAKRRRGTQKLFGQLHWCIQLGYLHFAKTCWCTPGWESMFLWKRKRGLVGSWNSQRESLAPQTHFCPCSFLTGKSSANISTFIISIVVIFIITILIIIISCSTIYIGSAPIWSNTVQYRFFTGAHSEIL